MNKLSTNSEANRLIEAEGLIWQIFACANRLEELFKDQGRKFTPDGHLVGSFGEILAAAHYPLALFPPSYPIHDAKSDAEGRQVQIRISQGRQIGIRQIPDHLLVLSLARDGSFE